MIFFNSDKRLTILKYFVIPMLAVFLSGCMGIGSKFDCNVDSGGRCAPMHHINQMANYGFFNNEKSYKAVNQTSITKNVGNTQYTGIKNEKNPMRSNEKIQQIWIGPYEDASGNYHEGSNIYVVVKKSEWVSRRDERVNG